MQSHSITMNQEAIRRVFRVVNQSVVSLQPNDRRVPRLSRAVVRIAGAERELTMMRWGMPQRLAVLRSPLSATRLRRTGGASRCLVPARIMRSRKAGSRSTGRAYGSVCCNALQIRHQKNLSGKLLLAKKIPRGQPDFNGPKSPASTDLSHPASAHSRPRNLQAMLHRIGS